MKLPSQGFLLASLFLAQCILFTSCSDEYHSKYATYAKASEFGAINRGWVPPGLPTSTHDIFEKHNIDLNWCNGNFRFAPCDVDLWQPMLMSATTSDLNDIQARQYATLKKRGFGFYKSDKYIFAVDNQNGHAFYWSRRSEASRGLPSSEQISPEQPPAPPTGARAR